MKRGMKGTLSPTLAALLRPTRGLRRSLARIYAHAVLSADLVHPAPASLVIEGRGVRTWPYLRFRIEPWLSAASGALPCSGSKRVET